MAGSPGPSADAPTDPILRPTCQVHLGPSSWSSSGWRPCLRHLPSLISVASLSPAFTVLDTGLLVGPQDHLCSSPFLLASMTLLPPRSICSTRQASPPAQLLCWVAWRPSWSALPMRLACVMQVVVVVVQRQGLEEGREPSTSGGMGFCGFSFTATLRWWWGLYFREEKCEAWRD